MKCLFKSLARFKNWVIYSLAIEFWEFLMYSGGKSFVSHVIFKYSLAYVQFCTFHLDNSCIHTVFLHLSFC